MVVGAAAAAAGVALPAGAEPLLVAVVVVCAGPADGTAVAAGSSMGGGVEK